MAAIMKNLQAGVLKRLQTEKIMLAMGFTWDDIKEELSISTARMNQDKKILDGEGARKASADIVDAYQDIKLIYVQSLHELQQIQDKEETNDHTKVSIIKEKTTLAKDLFMTGVESGVFDDREESSLENTSGLRAPGASMAEHIIGQLHRTSIDSGDDRETK